MKTILLILLFFIYASSCQKIQTMTTARSSTNINDAANPAHKEYTYLALGDSYTIGQSVPAGENYPNQVTRLLNEENLSGKAQIIAVTGWTTRNLEKGIDDASAEGELLAAYDIVTLLIGVNNQYQGEPSSDYLPKFETLLKRAIMLADNKPSHVIVISIPDWSVTPFAGVRDRNKIASEIDEYNAINKELSRVHGTGYLDVTAWTREAATDLSLLTTDLLHPSGKEYARWAKSLTVIMKEILR